MAIHIYVNEKTRRLIGAILNNVETSPNLGWPAIYYYHSSLSFVYLPLSKNSSIFYNTK